MEHNCTQTMYNTKKREPLNNERTTQEERTDEQQEKHRKNNTILQRRSRKTKPTTNTKTAHRTTLTTLRPRWCSVSFLVVVSNVPPRSYFLSYLILSYLNCCVLIIVMGAGQSHSTVQQYVTQLQQRQVQITEQQIWEQVQNDKRNFKKKPHRTTQRKTRTSAT